MHCRVDIEQAIIKAALKAGTTKNIKPFGTNSLLVNKKDFPAKGQTFKIANEKAEDLNERFGDKLSFVNQVKDGHEIVINPSEELIDDYWDGYIKSEGFEEQELSGVNRFGDSKPVYSEVISKSSKIDELFPVDDVTSNYEIINLIKEKGALHEKELIEILSPYVDETAPVEFTDELSNKKANGELSYNKGGTTNIKIRNTANGKTTIYLHELAHEVTLRQIDQYYTDKSKLNSEQIEAVKNLINVYEYSKKELINDSSYGMTNVAEFISEAFSNRKFQEKLNNIEYKNSSIFSKILDYLSQLLGIKQETALSETFNETIRLASNTTNVQELGDVNNTVFNEETSERQQKSPIEQYFQNRINRLIKIIKTETNKTKIEKAEIELAYTTEKLQESKIKENEKIAYLEFGKHTLDLAEQRINNLEKGTPSNNLEEDVEYINEVLDVWKDFTPLMTRVGELREKIQSMVDELIVKNVNEYYPTEKEITLKEISAQNKDIGTFKQWTGSILDIPNYITYTIGAIVRKSQNNIERRKNEIQNEIKDKIKEITKDGRKIQDVYDEIIFVNKKTNKTSLIPKGMLNRNAISKEASNFYDFYTSKMEELIKLSPTLTKRNKKGELELLELSSTFIPNVPKTSLKDNLKKLNPIKERKIGDFTKDEEQKADIIGIDYIKSLDDENKSKDLGNALNLFAQSLYNYDEMSAILPKVRILQRKLEKQSFIQGSNPNITKTGVDSGIWKITEAYIKAQIKGEYKNEEGRPKLYSTETGEKYIDITGTVDNMLRWNSLLRIGLSPIGASANVLFGKISNFMEAFGGQFFTNKDLRQAEKIFWQQVAKKDSVLNKELLEKYNILQELTDYNIDSSGETSSKFLSGDKLNEFLYAPQKYGEKWIQSSTLLATMLHDGYLSNDGKLTDKFTDASEKEKEALFAKITGVNNKLHGRYSPKEAAAMQQYVLYRAIMQFRKWLPAAIEARMDEKHYNPRLGVEVEGRYRTFGREVLLKLVKGDVKDTFYNLVMPLINAEEALKSGKIDATTIYNMRKMLLESVLALGTIILYGIGTGDDDEDKKRRKNPIFKTSMLLLNRVSGDLAFFYSPEQINNLSKNAIPMSKLVGDLINISGSIIPGFVHPIPEVFDENKNKFKSGINKGAYKLPIRVGGLIPGNKVFFDPFKMFNDEQLTGI